MEVSELELQVAGTKYAVNMVEAAAKEVPEETMLKAILFGHENIKELVQFQEEAIAQIEPEKRPVEIHEIDQTFEAQVTAQAEALELFDKIQEKDKQIREANITEVKNEIIASLDEEDEDYGTK